jgi:ribosomal RNA-processing protein 17
MAPARKKRRVDTSAVQEITFDPTARQEYLTGFHKRKQARIQNAKETAVRREKEERVKERRQVSRTPFCGVRRHWASAC